MSKTTKQVFRRVIASASDEDDDAVIDNDFSVPEMSLEEVWGDSKKAKSPKLSRSTKPKKLTKTNIRRSRKSSDIAEVTIHCTSCKTQINQNLSSSFSRHPHLPVLMCKFLECGLWHRDDQGKMEECLWCGDGGAIILCSNETCDKAFCRKCMKQHLSRQELTRIESSESEHWSCFFCDQTQIAELAAQCKKVFDHIDHAEEKQKEKARRRIAAAAAASPASPGSPSKTTDLVGLVTTLRTRSERTVNFLRGVEVELKEILKGDHMVEQVIAAERVSERLRESLGGIAQLYQQSVELLNIGLPLMLPEKGRKDPTRTHTSSIVQGTKDEEVDYAEFVGRAHSSPSTSKAITPDYKSLLFADLEESTDELEAEVSSGTRDVPCTEAACSMGDQLAMASRKVSGDCNLASTSQGLPRDESSTPHSFEDDEQSYRKSHYTILSRASTNVTFSEKTENNKAGGKCKDVMTELKSSPVITISDDESGDEDGCENFNLELESSNSSDVEGTSSKLRKKKQPGLKVSRSVLQAKVDEKVRQRDSSRSLSPDHDSELDKILHQRVTKMPSLQRRCADSVVNEPHESDSDACLHPERRKQKDRCVPSGDVDLFCDDDSVVETKTVALAVGEGPACRKEESPSPIQVELMEMACAPPVMSGIVVESDDSDVSVQCVKQETKVTTAKVCKSRQESYVDESSSGSDSTLKVMKGTRVRKVDALLRKTIRLPGEEVRKKRRKSDTSDEDIHARKKSKRKSWVVTSDSEKASESEYSVDESSESEGPESRGASVVDSDDDFVEPKQRTLAGSRANAKKKLSDGKSMKVVKSAASSASGSKMRRRVKLSSSDEDCGKNDSDNNDEKINEESSKKRQRKIMKPSDLQEATKEAFRMEQDRKARIEKMQQEYNFIEMTEASVPGSPTKVQKVTRVVLEYDNQTPIVEVHPFLVEKLKPHQAEGVQFLYNTVVESCKKTDSTGSGCILAHCMGLGKTLQMIAFIHTVLTSKLINLRTCLVVAPLNTVLNWVAEFEQWLADDDLKLNVFELSTSKPGRIRAELCEEWQQEGGVMIMGYDMFRNLARGSNIKQKKQKEIFERCLLTPGADMVVCDEGHMLKNSKTQTSIQMNRVETLRRICLTGTPLQNNLMEYHTMVNFVKPNLLGTPKEFKNRFENPIKQGQCADSTPSDVRQMKRRAHILHNMLDGCVHRRDYSALTKFLPPKMEYVLSIRLMPRQCELYTYYLDKVVKFLDVASLRARKSLFADYQNLQRVWTHPYALVLQQIEADKRARYNDDAEELASFIDDEQDDEDESDSATTDEESKRARKIASQQKQAKKASTSKASDANGDEDFEPSSESELEQQAEKKWITRRTGGGTIADECQQTPTSEAKRWFSSLVSDEDEYKLELSGKLTLLFEILKKCEEIGDKLLVFSQSLISLNMIEAILQRFEATEWPSSQNSLSLLSEEKWGWVHGLDYFRMDGSTPASVRKLYANKFNDLANLRTRLFLISTRAGGLGINLVAANRVVIFDASWNPSHDIQSIFRVYRFGQLKPVYVYRFIAQGTMEEKIYDRQVTKQSLSCRVIDEQQIERHFTAADLEELYSFNPDDPNAKKKRPTAALPKDRLLADMFIERKDLIMTYHEHDSLLENKADEQLSEAERKAAWQDYEQEKIGRQRMPTVIQDDVKLRLARLVYDGNAILKLAQSLGETVDTTMQVIMAKLMQRNEYRLNSPSPAADAWLENKLTEMVGQMQRMLADKQANLAAFAARQLPPGAFFNVSGVGARLPMYPVSTAGVPLAVNSYANLEAPASSTQMPPLP